MLKGKGQFGGKETLIFGLSHINLERLKDGKPIMVLGQEMGVQFNILIFSGKDEVTMANDIKGPNTIVVDIPVGTKAKVS